MPTFEELQAAGAVPGDAPPNGKGLTFEQLQALGAEPGSASPSRPSRPLPGMRPEPKPDEVLPGDVRPDYTKHDAASYFGGGGDSIITLPGTREAKRARIERDDPIRNDPLAGMIMQSIPAAGAGAVAAGLTRLAAPAASSLIGGATTGALSDPDHPLTGALLGAIPGAGAAARGADLAIGKAALARAGEKTFENAGKVAGAGAGATVGHKAAGFVGAGLGAGAGAKVGGAAGRLADRGVEALADRYLARTAQLPAGPLYTPPTFPGAAPGRGGPIIDADMVHAPPAPGVPLQLGPASRLAPLVPSPRPQPASAPNGAFGTPFLDDFGVPVTRAGQGGFLPTDAPTGAGAGPLRADVVRDAAAFRRAPYDAQPVQDLLGDQLANSVRLLDELRAGKITAKQAIDAGLPSGIANRTAR